MEIQILRLEMGLPALISIQMGQSPYLEKSHSVYIKIGMIKNYGVEQH